MKRSLIFLLPAFLAFGSCATMTRTIDKGTGAVGELLLPVSEEVRLGNQLANEVNQTEKIHPDREIQAYVAKVGKRIATASKDKRKGVTYRFTVVDNPNVVNAFALPGGHIYVYSGLILAAQSEAELAAVLGHEVGHVTSRHAARSLGAAFGLEALSRIALGNDPGTLTQIASGIAAQGYMSRHSRDAEREADARGLDYMIAAGYDPKAMPRFFDELHKRSGSANSLQKFFASHPEPRERAKTLHSTINVKGTRGGRSEIVGGFSAIQARIRGGGAAGKKTAPTTSGKSAPTPSKAPTPARR